jgi:hypothetical protein
MISCLVDLIIANTDEATASVKVLVRMQNECGGTAFALAPGDPRSQEQGAMRRPADGHGSRAGLLPT